MHNKSKVKVKLITKSKRKKNKIKQNRKSRKQKWIRIDKDFWLHEEAISLCFSLSLRVSSSSSFS